ncbi:MAG: response regulator transcription factor [Bacteroidales bacterium]|nr:response regulator transcription factor [Bacteroidales bacterium]
MIEKIDKEIRILIVEDQPVCRLGIRMTLSGSDIKHRILSEAENVAQAIDFLEKHGKDIDLVLLDYVLPDGTGMDVIAAVKRLHLDVKIVILSGEAGGAILKQLMDAGVNGFMSKSVNPEEIAVVLNSVMQGHDYTGEGLMRIEDDLKADYETMKSLTRREMELVTLCANGLNAKQIAEEMNVTPHSVENMKSTIFAKVGVKSTNELILYAFRVGLIS